MKKHIIIIGLCLLLISSCFWLTGKQKLGHRIYRVDKEILFSTDETYKGSADVMIPPDVLEVRHNKEFIIVKCESSVNKIEFWLIDKTQKSEYIKEILGDSSHWLYHKYANVYGPLDSIEFISLKKQKGVELEW